jgi:hypothetical protein
MEHIHISKFSITKQYYKFNLKFLSFKPDI